MLRNDPYSSTLSQLSFCSPRRCWSSFSLVLLLLIKEGTLTVIRFVCLSNNYYCFFAEWPLCSQLSCFLGSTYYKTTEQFKPPAFCYVYFSLVVDRLITAMWMYLRSQQSCPAVEWPVLYRLPMFV